MEIVDVATNDVVESDVVSVGGKRFFGDYWGRWLNRYGAGSKHMNGRDGNGGSGNENTAEC